MKRPAPTKTAASTIEAVMYVLTTRRGVKELEDMTGLGTWLEACDRAAIEEIKRRLLNMRAGSKRARPNWSVEDVAKVVAAWERVQNESHDHPR